jgi:hypothetical protein
LRTVERVLIRNNSCILEEIGVEIGGEVNERFDVAVQLRFRPLLFDLEQGLKTLVCALMTILELPRMIRIENHDGIVMSKIGI